MTYIHTHKYVRIHIHTYMHIYIPTHFNGGLVYVLPIDDTGVVSVNHVVDVILLDQILQVLIVHHVWYMLHNLKPHTLSTCISYIVKYIEYRYLIDPFTPLNTCDPFTLRAHWLTYTDINQQIYLIYIQYIYYKCKRHILVFRYLCKQLLTRHH